MPHYSNGIEARIGDVIKGKGYNIKDDDGDLAEIVGTLVHITPDASACNVQVAVTEVHELAQGLDYKTLGLLQINGVRTVTDSDGITRLPLIRIEYGQADHFTKVT